jgi:hypothetical protein
LETPVSNSETSRRHVFCAEKANLTEKIVGAKLKVTLNRERTRTAPAFSLERKERKGERKGHGADMHCAPAFSVWAKTLIALTAL